MNNQKIRIIKADGEKEFFDRVKLVDSLKRTGVSDKVTEKIVKHIEEEIINDMSTTDIYRHAFNLLRENYPPLATRYSLRRALVDFGPSGFPFEDYVAEIFKARGWSAFTDKILKGHCVEHEVDVVAWKDDHLILAEVKFHNELGFKTDLKVALYVKARMDDLRAVTHFIGDKERKLSDGYLITNTKFSSSAIQYGSCAGLKMIGWNYPEKENLQSIIESENLHPLTCLTSLNTMQKEELFAKEVVLCKTLVDVKDVLSFLHLGKIKEEEVLSEVKNLCIG